MPQGLPISATASVLAARIVLKLLVVCTFGAVALPVSGIERFWRTDGPSAYWSDPNNWDHVGVPQNGDDLFFSDRFLISGSDSTVNDLTDLSVESLNFSIPNASFMSGWDLNGNPLTVTHGISAFGVLSAHVNCDVKLGGHVVF